MTSKLTKLKRAIKKKRLMWAFIKSKNLEKEWIEFREKNWRKANK